jgi:DNA mismatch repair ATPase MutL
MEQCEGYIYMIHTQTCILLNLNVFKVGRTKRHYNNRLQEYEINSKPIVVLQTNDCVGAEQYVLKNFKQQYIRRRDFGLEYFEGEEIEMREYLEFLVNDFNKNIIKISSSNKNNIKSIVDFGYEIVAVTYDVVNGNE